MNPDQIKAAAIEAAAEAMCLDWQRGRHPDNVRSWDETSEDCRASFVSDATIAVNAYERAMVRPLSDAPAYDPIGDRQCALLWVPRWGFWCPGTVWRLKDNTPRALVSGCPWEDDDLPLFRLLPAAPETTP